MDKTGVVAGGSGTSQGQRRGLQRGRGRGQGRGRQGQSGQQSTAAMPVTGTVTTGKSSCGSRAYELYIRRVGRVE